MDGQSLQCHFLDVYFCKRFGGRGLPISADIVYLPLATMTDSPGSHVVLRIHSVLHHVATTVNVCRSPRNAALWHIVSVRPSCMLSVPELLQANCGMIRQTRIMVTFIRNGCGQPASRDMMKMIMQVTKASLLAGWIFHLR